MSEETLHHPKCLVLPRKVSFYQSVFLLCLPSQNVFVLFVPRTGHFRRGIAKIQPGYPIVNYRGTSLIRKQPPLGSYSRTMPRALCCSQGGGVFL